MIAKLSKIIIINFERLNLKITLYKRLLYRNERKKSAVCDLRLNSSRY